MASVQTCINVRLTAQWMPDLGNIFVQEDTAGVPRAVILLDVDEAEALLASLTSAVEQAREKAARQIESQ